MREILFRSKTIENEQWVEGYFVHVPCGRFLSEEYLIQTIKDDGRIGQLHTVYESTVEQFTGLTDKNGKKIFEGDIVKITDTIVEFETSAYIKFGNPNAQYSWGFQLVPLEYKPFAVDILHWVDMEESGAFIEVIGNIHDNPELLEGKRWLN